MSFKEFLNEEAKIVKVLSLEFKGKTIKDSAEYVIDRLNKVMGAVIYHKYNDESTVVLVYSTKNSGEKAFNTVFSKKPGMSELSLNGKSLGEFVAIGYIEVDEDGKIYKIDGAKAGDKVDSIYVGMKF
jgi:hypothetical protein